MPKLNISLKGDQYTHDQKKAFWIQIHDDDQCPECGAMFSMLQGPRCGLASNIKCKYCHVVFYTTPFPELGAYPISIDNPPQEERRLIDDKDNQSARV